MTSFARRHILSMVREILIFKTWKKYRPLDPVVSAS